MSRSVPGEPVPGIQIGGCGCWTGRGQMFTWPYFSKRPFHGKGRGSDHAFRISSRCSR